MSRLASVCACRLVHLTGSTLLMLIDNADQCVWLSPGFDLGFWADDRHFINNHLMFKILVFKTNGQYTKARKRYEELEAASVVEVSCNRSAGRNHSADRNQSVGCIHSSDRRPASASLCMSQS